MTDSLAFIAEFECRRTVRWVDTDPSGYAHFASYVRMMEETEYAFLRDRGLSVVLQDERGTIGFPRLSADIEILSPLACDDTVVVGIRLAAMDGKQVTYEFEMTDEANQPRVRGKFVAACCRFPNGELPFAILIPEWIGDRLVGNDSPTETARPFGQI